VRIAVPACVAPHVFEDLPRVAGTTAEVCRGLLLAGLKLGSDPLAWRFTPDPVPAALFREVKFFDFASGTWLAVDMHDLVCRN
jgi:hypothetical protein